MNKTININLSGFAFQMDEEAYNKLKTYLDTLLKRLGNNSEAKEIVQDIERRIAELFKDNYGLQNQIISLSAVNEIIETIGEPSEIIDEDLEEKEDEPVNSQKVYTGKRRLYRDPENRVLGGVCGGLGAYFNIDPLIFRVLAIVITLTVGVAPFVYIILWIAMPKAISLSQRMEMQGGYTFQKFEDDFKKEYEKAAGKFKNYKSSYSSNRGSSIIGFIIGLFLIIWSSIAIISVVGMISCKETIINFFNLADIGYINSIPERIATDYSLTLLHIAAYTIVGIPLLVIFYYGIKLMFNLKSRNRYLGVTTFLIWIGGIGLAFYALFNTALDFKEKAIVSEEIYIPQKKFNTLRIEGSDNSTSRYSSNYVMEINQLHIFQRNNNIHIEGEPHIYVNHGPNLNISITTSANGKTESDARSHIEDIRYNLTMQDSILTLDQAFILDEVALMRNQKVDINIDLPPSMNLKIDPELQHLVVNY